MKKIPGIPLWRRILIKIESLFMTIGMVLKYGITETERKAREFRIEEERKREWELKKYD